MAKAYASIDIARSAAEVWQLIGGFNALPDWLPYIPSSQLEEGGRVRRIRNLDGEEIVERLMAFDEVSRSYSYHILKAISADELSGNLARPGYRWWSHRTRRVVRAI
jgi:hypothetical protein